MQAFQNADHDRQNNDLANRADGEREIRDTIALERFEVSMFFQPVCVLRCSTGLCARAKRGYLRFSTA